MRLITIRCWFSVAILSLSPAAGPAAQFTLDNHTFTLPEGFTIERIAGPGLTDRPIHADFDEQGRLYLAESSGSNAPVKQQLEDKPHSILRLEDTDGDGVFDRRTVFADRMMFPEGILWHDGSAYVGAPPEIWKLTDMDDDGVADRREVWFNPGTLTGCANDLHGPFPGRDGWIYWSKGAFAEQQLDRAEGGQLVTKAAHIFRRHPSGGGIEPVMTGGMDNPVEVVMTPGGDRFFTSTFMRHPGGGLRDGIGFASYGSMFGKDHDVLNGHPRAGASLNDPLIHLGPAAPTGLHYSESAAFGEAYRGNLYATLFNLQKVTRHALIPEGAGYRTIDEDFLVSDNRDFHPTDVFEDADGSLIVIDTGGWYKICCPTSQLYKPDVLGAVYRIRKSGMAKIDDPRGLALAWEGVASAELARRLADQRPFVVRRSMKRLSDRGEDAVPALRTFLSTGPTAEARVAAVWTLSRIPGEAARSLTRERLDDADATVRQAALYSTALWRDQAPAELLVNRIKHGPPREQRLAAEGLGRIQHVAAVPVLIETLATTDAVLAQALTRSLIDIADAGAIRVALGEGTSVPPGALLALDQLGAARPEDALALLGSNNDEARQTAHWIIRRHADWGPALTRRFGQELDALSEPADAFAGLIGRMAGDRSIQEWLAAQLGRSEASEAARITLLNAMHRAGLKFPPPAWSPRLVEILRGEPSATVLSQAVATVGGFELKAGRDREIEDALVTIARQSSRPAALRLAAVSALPDPFAQDGDGQLFRLALDHVGTEQPVALRQTAARVVGRQPLSAEQRQALAAELSDLGPMELNQVLGGLAEPLGDDSDAAVLSAVAGAKALRSIPVDRLRTTFAKYPESLQARIAELVSQLDEEFADKQARIDALLAELKGGDVVRGQAIFNSAKAVCSSCHAIGYLGGDLGPDLTRIGQVRSERDLLEAIVYPSASFVRSYESVRVTTRDGEDYSGVVREDAGDHLTLATGPGATVRVARSEIAELLPGSVSIMPAGLDEQLNKQELADLLAFLKATRW